MLFYETKKILMPCLVLADITLWKHRGKIYNYV